MSLSIIKQNWSLVSKYIKITLEEEKSNIQDQMWMDMNNLGFNKEEMIKMFIGLMQVGATYEIKDGVDVHT